MNRRRRPAGQPSAPRRSAPTGPASTERRSPRANPRPVAPRDPFGDFWGRTGDEDPQIERIRPTPDPGALPRSLGDPPLGPNPLAAQHHLAAVYEEAVRAATALAAANGLLDTEST
ncbi:MAG: hypothetical protein ACRDV9_07615 [Acidimicrobiia bacterium]